MSLAESKFQLFFSALNIDTHKLSSANLEDKLRYIKEQYFNYVKDNNPENTEVFKIINEVYSEIRKNPGIVDRYVALPAKEKEKSAKSKPNRHQSVEKEFIHSFYFRNKEDDIYDEIIVPLSLRQIYNCNTKVINLKNRDVITFSVNPYNYTEPIRVWSRNQRLYVIRVALQDSKWHLDEDKNLITTIELSLYDCILGTVTTLEHIDGKVIKVEIPPETYDKVVLNNMGWPLAQYKNTKLIIKIKIKFPKNLSEYEREIIRTLQKIDKNKNY